MDECYKGECNREKRKYSVKSLLYGHDNTPENIAHRCTDADGPVRW